MVERIGRESSFTKSIF